MKPRGIRGWLLLAFLTLAFAPLIGGGLLFLRVYENALQETVAENLARIADKKYDQIDAFIDERYADIGLLSGRPSVLQAMTALSNAWKSQGFAGETYRELMRGVGGQTQAFAESGNYYDLLLIDVAGNVVFSLANESDLGSNLFDGPYRDSGLAEGYKMAIRMLHINQTAFAPYAPSQQRVASFLVAPLLDQGQLLGAVALQFNLDRLTSVVSDRAGLGSSGETVLAQLDGDQVLYTAQLRHVEHAAFRFRMAINDADQPMRHALAGQVGRGVVTDYAGHRVVAAWRYLPTLRWGMVVKIDADEAFASLRRIEHILLTALGLTILAISVLASYFGTALIRPIQRLMEASARAARGDFSIRDTASGPKELRQLSESFNRMNANLGKLYSGLEAEVRDRNREIEVRKDTERQLSAARDAAEAANRAKSVFLANMSHELRTPLNAILGFSQLMEHDQRLPSDVNHNLQTINRAGRHLLALINDVLEISRIEAGRTSIQNAPFDLIQTVATIEEMIRPRAEQKGLAFSIERSGGIPHYVDGDANHLRQVLINLLGNAVKYTDRGCVGLKISACDDRVSFDISDTGIGIAADEQEHVFQPFYQTESGIAKGEGTGLGLAISREFVRLMGGELMLESGLGRGSVFRFSLPLPEVAVPLVDTRQRRVLGLMPGQDAVRILVAEDNADNQELIACILKAAGFQVRVAENGQRAVELFQAWCPHLIWMDMRMPVMDGYRATQQIRALPGGGEVKIVALTASAFQENRQAILEAGCDDMLAKPIDENRLYLLMADLLGLRYCYADDGVPGAATDLVLPAEQSLSGGLPASLRARLVAAAELLDVDAVLEIVDDMLADYPDTAHIIGEWVGEYRFDKLIEFCQPAADEKP